MRRGKTQLRLTAARFHFRRKFPSPADDFLPEGTTLQDHEQHLIRAALQKANGNKSQAARLLGLTRNALRYRLSQMGLD